MIQAKGKTYLLKDLLRDEEMAKRFEGGAFATIYLAPFNYHRIHSPAKGEVVGASYCPGTLWPVNAGSVERVEGLFCINERLTSHIRLDDGSEMLVVKVGATNVGRIAVAYSKELVTNVGKLPRNCKRYDWKPSEKVLVEKGGELGRFEMGSTVILVVDKKIRERNPALFQSRVGTAIKVGEAL
jgi:phosphatidylserine decarboxylase